VNILKLTILKEYLNESVQHVLKAISGKTTIPILNGIKIEANGNGVVLTGSDTDISIQSFIPVNQDDVTTIVETTINGSVILPAKFFSEIIRKLPSPRVEIEVKEQFQTYIRSGKAEIHIIGLDPEEYPLLPTIDETNSFTVSSDLLKSMIRQTVFAVSTNESTPILTGVLWTLSNGKLTFTGCDRHRLATRSITVHNKELEFNNIVIAGKTLNELNKLLPDQNTEVDVIIADNQILVKMNSILFYSRILDGTYPDTTRLIPSQYQTELIIHTKRLADAIDRAYLLSREDKTNIVRMFMLNNDMIEISSSSSELGKVTEQLETTSLTGELLRISFNSKYMLDSLKALDSEKILIGFTGAMQPIIMKPEDETEILQLILPYRTTT
jgi:DNA polymerase III subunit beta